MVPLMPIWRRARLISKEFVQDVGRDVHWVSLWAAAREMNEAPRRLADAKIRATIVTGVEIATR